MQIAINLKQFIFKQDLIKKAEKKDAVDIPITREIEQTLNALKCTRSNFDFETDPNMIEALIYEERALLSRYKHLIELARQKNIKCSHTMHLSMQ